MNTTVSLLDSDPDVSFDDPRASLGFPSIETALRAYTQPEVFFETATLVEAPYVELMSPGSRLVRKIEGSNLMVA